MCCQLLDSQHCGVVIKDTTYWHTPQALAWNRTLVIWKGGLHTTTVAVPACLNVALSPYYI